MNIDTNKNNIEVEDQYFNTLKKSTTISFDIVLWLYRILKYWYLFVISIAICFGFAYLKNKSWVASYSSQALIVLEARGNSSVVRGAVPVATMLQNTANQQILLSSYGMTERSVRKLPMHAKVNYYRQTPFKRDDLYSNTPVRITPTRIDTTMAYGCNFTLSAIDDTTCKITYVENGIEKNIEAVYDQEVKTNLFTLKLKKANASISTFAPFNFQFLSQQDLINIFHGRASSSLLKIEASALAIHINGTEPLRDIEYLNVLLNEFETYNLQIKNEQADLTIKFLSGQLDIINDSLHTSRVKLDVFQKNTGVYEITSPNLRKEIDEAETGKKQLALKEKSLLIFTDKIAKTITENVGLVEPKELNIEEGAVGALVAEYNRIIEGAKYMGSKNPLYNQTIDQLNVLRVNILKELQRLQNIVQEEKDILIEQFQLLDLKVDNLPPQERDLVKHEREYKVNEMYHQFLTQKRYEAEIQKASNTPDNFVWEYPRQLGGAGNAGALGKTYMFWLMIGALIPLAFVVLKEEVFNYTIATKEECEKLSGLPVIGTIENIANKIKGGAVLVKNYPKSSFAEAFRNIRIRLEYMAKKESNVSVLVTSAEPADGKTFVAINIASVYQLMQKKVVVLDLDLRRPSVATTLEIEGGRKGVSNYLIGQVTLEDIIFTHPDYDFDIIPAGTLPPNPSELIKTAKTAELIKQLQAIYDYVIVDCSPVGLVSDAYVLAPLVDTTLFIVRRGKTNRSFFKSVIQQMKFDGIDNVSVVFNDVKGREGFYGTSRYYGDRGYYMRKNSYYHDDYSEK